MKTTKWLNVEFESACVKTEQFAAFVRDFRSDLNSMLKNTDWKLAKPMLVGHFYISAFLHNEVTDKFVYISISDVRYWKNEWSKRMLIRTAKNVTDYTGGYNNFCQFHNLPLALTRF